MEEKIITNNERVRSLSDEDFVRFSLNVAIAIANHYIDPYRGLEEWLHSTNPGHIYRSLMGDWS